MVKWTEGTIGNSSMLSRSFPSYSYDVLPPVMMHAFIILLNDYQKSLMHASVHNRLIVTLVATDYSVIITNLQ